MKSRIKITATERVDYRKIILSSLALTGVVTMAIFAPNAIQAIKLFDNRKRHHLPYYLRGKAEKLKDQGHIRFINKSGTTYIEITAQGLSLLERYRIEELLLEARNRKWDGQWRIIIFDIKEYRRGVRDQLRRELASFGFVRLQNSVWVFPYDCEELIILLKADLKIGRDLIYIVSNKVEGDVLLRQRFGLTV